MIPTNPEMPAVEICGTVSDHDGALRQNATCVRPKGHGYAELAELGTYHGTELDVYSSGRGYFWHTPKRKPTDSFPSTEEVMS